MAFLGAIISYARLHAYIASVRTDCEMFSGATLRGCRGSPHFWTAGQRIDPSRGSPFIWRVTSTDTYRDTVSIMTYTNWHPGEPNNSGGESCANLISDRQYKWNDVECTATLCSVCELDIG